MDAWRLPRWGAMARVSRLRDARPRPCSQSPEALSDVTESRVKLVGDFARPYGNNYIKIEAVALVTGLDNTGEDPAPSPQREALLHEMKTRGVERPNQCWRRRRLPWCWVRRICSSRGAKGRYFRPGSAGSHA